MDRTYDIIRGTLILIVCVFGLGWFAWWRFRESTNRGAMVVRWLVTGGLLFYLFAYTGPKIVANMASGSTDAVFGFLTVVVGGLILAIIWVPEIVGSIGQKFGSLFDGGSTPVEPKPFYSIALALKNQGNYARSLAEVRTQLERFPMDMEGQMMMATLQAENLDDLPGAQLTITHFCDQPGHAPANVAYALNLLADWHLKITRDRESAQAALQDIIHRLPDTEMALQAAQRIGRLADTESLLAGADRRQIILKKGIENLGLRMDSSRFQKPESTPQQLAAEYVQHLSDHPLDTLVREQLAVLYAQHYHRLDLAADQLDQLIQMPNQPVKQVVHWLNLLADLQIQERAPIENAQATLQRIIDQYPDAATTFNTRRRLDTLKLEYRANEKNADVQLGTYEQNIGLKRHP